MVKKNCCSLIINRSCVVGYSFSVKNIYTQTGKGYIYCEDLFFADFLFDIEIKKDSAEKGAFLSDSIKGIAFALEKTANEKITHAILKV